MGGGVTVKDVSAGKFIPEYASLLKRTGKVEVPAWADIAKTGCHREMCPANPDWFYVRCAAVARHIYLRGGVGVGALTKVYGGRQRSMKGGAFYQRGSGSVARAVLKCLEAIEVLEKDEEGGRRVTRKGRRDLDRIAGVCASQ